MTSSLRGVLLDIDGTLVDSNDAHALAWVEAMEHHGYKVDYQAVRDAIGMGGDKLLPAILEVDAASEEGKSLSHEHGQIFRSKYLGKVRAFPRIREFVERVQGAGLQVALATSSQPQVIDTLLRFADIDDLVKVAADKSAVNFSKPSPDVIHVAMTKLGLTPHEVVMIGDTPYDVESARRAGVRVIALRCGGHSDEMLKNATAIFDDIADLLRNLERSPLAESLTP